MFLPEKYKAISWKKIGEVLLVSVVFILVASISFFGIQWNLNSKKPVSLQASVLTGGNENAEPLTVPEKPEDLAIQAMSAIAVEFNNDAEENILFEKNSNDRLPIASLVKMMTALVVMDTYNLNQEVVVSKAVMEQVGAQGVLKEGEILSVRNLLYIALIESSNRAAFALSEVIGANRFVALMNKKAEEIGLADTYFADSTGLDATSYSTASNVAQLSEYLFLYYPLFGEIVGLKEYNLYLPNKSLHHKLESTNELLGQQGIVGGKTGYTNAARGCFMALQKKSAERNIIYIVLGAEDRLLDMQRLINFTN
jgi:D-alanyl-D-alanine carboxypeptidase